MEKKSKEAETRLAVKAKRELLLQLAAVEVEHVRTRRFGRRIKVKGF